MLRIAGLDVVLDEKRILRDLDLDVDDGELVGLLGPSGSGKSTLLRAVAGLVEPAAGQITWNDADLTQVPPHQRGFGLMFQGFALFPHMTVGENVGFGLRMQRRNQPDVVSDSLEMVGLAGYQDRDVDTLSGGERQRVALARTLAPKPRFIMLDEPLGALDRNLRVELMEQTRSILKAQGATALIVTHDRDEAAAMTDRLALIRDGTVVQTGTLDNLVSHPNDDWVAAFLT